MPGFRITANEPGGSPAWNYETARSYRWLFLSIGTPSLPSVENADDIDLNSILILLHKCQRPRFEIVAMPLHNGPQEISIPGKYKWPPIEFSFYECLNQVGSEFKPDTTDPNVVPPPAPTKRVDLVASKIYNWYRKSLLDVNTGYVVRGNYLRDCELTMLDGGGVVVWKYTLHGCWPSKITPTELDYSLSNIAEITVTLNINRASESLE